MSTWSDTALVASIERTPAVVLDHRVLVANVQRMAVATTEAGVGLRPHAKTHKLPAVARLQVEAGAVGIQVVTLHEAEVFADAGIEDILIGYPIVGASGIRRLVALARRCRIAVGLDSLEVARPIAAEARTAGVVIELRLEVELGLQRTGVDPDGAPEIAARLADLPGVSFGGIMTHEGQLYSESVDRAALATGTLEVAGRLAAVAARIRDRGIACDAVSIGSSATAASGMRAPGITEIRPGTYVFNDGTQLGQGAATLDQVAATVVATVISRPAPDRAVIDAGSKTLAADRRIMPDPPLTFGTMPLLPDHELVRISEEHGVLSLPSRSSLRVGDRVTIVPNHICPVINLADEVLVADGGRIVDRWPVAARGHR